MTMLHSQTFPQESTEYRAARNQLLEEEIELRQRIEQIAEKRRTLPLGGKVPENYAFHKPGSEEVVLLSDLFQGGKDVLAIYTLMYGPNSQKACPMCVALLDGLNGEAAHISQNINLAVVAKAPGQKLENFLPSRNWDGLNILSSFETNFQSDYNSESEDGDQWPLLHIFKKIEGDVFHCYTTEMLYCNTGWEHEPRHVDMLWGLWNMLDLTPAGRDLNWHPELQD
ncbi:MAG: DUF899 family protein [Sneathiella sp.]